MAFDVVGTLFGANHAGLLTAWVARKEKAFHSAMGTADLTGEALTDIVTALGALPE